MPPASLRRDPAGMDNSAQLALAEARSSAHRGLPAGPELVSNAAAGQGKGAPARLGHRSHGMLA